MRAKENFNWVMRRRKKVDCQSFNVVYMSQCNKTNCNAKYIGKTGRNFKFRLDEN